MTGSSRAIRASYELRLLGGVGLGTPPATVGVFVAFAALSWLLGAEDATIARLLVSALEVGLPLGAGIAAAGITAQDPAVGLQLALKTRYRSTLARRLGLLLLWCALLALVSTAALYVAGLWSLWVPGGPTAGQLVWIPPLLWYAAAGAVLSLLTRSRTAAGTLLGGLWTCELFFHEVFLSTGWLRAFYPFVTTLRPGADFWPANRVALAAFAVALGVVAWALASDSERLSKGDEG